MSDENKRIAADILIAAINKGGWFSTHEHSINQLAQAFQTIYAAVELPGSAQGRIPPQIG